MKKVLLELSIEEWAAGVYNGEITFNLPNNVKTDSDYTLTVVVKEKVEESEEVLIE